MSAGRKPFWLLLLLALAGGAEPASAREQKEAVPARPLWISHPKSDDSAFLYRIGQATGLPSAEAAKTAAYLNALEGLAREMLTTLEIEGDTTVIRSHMTFQGVEIMAHAVHIEEGPGGFACWMQVSYPRSERSKVMDEIAAARQQDQAWERAQAAFVRGDFGTAQLELTGILNQTGSLAYVRFSLDAAKKMLGDTYREQKNYLEARHWYENLEAFAEDGTLRGSARQALSTLPEPPMMWPMRDRWAGRKVGLICGLRDGAGLRSFDAMTRMLRRECQQAQLTAVDLGRGLEPMDLEDVLDVEILSALAPDRETQQIGVILAILYDVDPAKSASSDHPVIDTVVRYFIADGLTGQIVDRNQFKEMTGTQSADRMAARSVEILIRRYLVPGSPALLEK